ncbi:uncharacterized protein BXZ73DRAFT_105306 [Epithele typhae]|uniref:uncharacterized protein n=1 Tax=Epithele typhae TaxID=378194 RepID=UPI002007E6AD|nr:uncharacterized protein BXZ73DRAFT_105306 [Epithele typhae]KAH9918181.1 hypothetical protein BXZ73DRAFT_105306 [Epithele typhae]
MRQLFELQPSYWSWTKGLKAIDQVLEILEYLHSRNIAHCDYMLENVVWARGDEPVQGAVPHQPYIIDFERSMVLPLGPGKQGRVQIPDTRFIEDDEPPLDPYAWDMYCFGRDIYTFVVHFNYDSRVNHTEPWVLKWYQDWIYGIEDKCRGCPDVAPEFKDLEDKDAANKEPEGHRARLVEHDGTGGGGAMRSGGTGATEARGRYLVRPPHPVFEPDENRAVSSSRPT